MNHFYYKIYGLSILSELELLPLRQEVCEKSDVQIIIGRNPDHLTDIDKKGILFEISQFDFLFKFPSVGSYRVQKGKSITIDPHPDAEISEICVFLFGSVFGALLHQLGEIPLHGSSIVVNNKAVSIIGSSASGKSSLAAGFASKGYKILSDDISVLSKSIDQKYKIQPGLPYLKLWEDVRNYMNIDKNLIKVRPTINKFIQPLKTSYQDKPIELATIICLEISNRNTFSSELVEGSEKFNLINSHLYRNQYIYGRVMTQRSFTQLADISRKTVLYRVSRPEQPLRIYELVEYLINQVIDS